MDILDVAGLSMDLSSTRVINDVQVAVLILVRILISEFNLKGLSTLNKKIAVLRTVYTIR